VLPPPPPPSDVGGMVTPGVLSSTLPRALVACHDWAACAASRFSFCTHFSDQFSFSVSLCAVRRLLAPSIHPLYLSWLGTNMTSNMVRALDDVSSLACFIVCSSMACFGIVSSSPLSDAVYRSCPCVIFSHTACCPCVRWHRPPACDAPPRRLKNCKQAYPHCPAGAPVSHSHLTTLLIPCPTPTPSSAQRRRLCWLSLLVPLAWT
jgi:hypothetical protein